MDKLLYWCAGVDLVLINRASPQDRGRYAMLGVFILFTAALSGTSMFFMAGYVTAHPLACTAMALAWATFIFSIDRYLAISITSFKAHIHPGDLAQPVDNTKESTGAPAHNASPGYLMAIITRLMAAIFLSIVISIPVKLALFEPDINGLLAIENRDAATDFFVFDPQITAFKTERAAIQVQIVELRKAIEDAESQMNARYEQMQNESNGKGGSGKKGFGPYYEQAKTAFEQAKISWESTRATNTALINNLVENDKTLQARIAQQTEAVALQAQHDDGLLSRYRALNKLAASNPPINTTLWLISLLFIFIEAFPVFTKASQKRDSYEKLLVKLALEEQPQKLSNFLEQQQVQLQQEIKNTPFVVPNQYRAYLIMLGVGLCTAFPFTYNWVFGSAHALTPTIVFYMFAPLAIVLAFVVTELVVLRARTLWQSLKPSEDLNFSLQSLAILLMPIGVLLYLALNPTPELMHNNLLIIDTSPLSDHGAFWSGWALFYGVLLFLVSKNNAAGDAAHELARQKQIESVEHKVQHARQAYRKGCLSLYVLSAFSAFCCFLLFLKLPADFVQTNYWQLLGVFMSIPALAVMFYGMGIRVPITTLLSIANTRLKRLYTLSVIFFSITATVMCGALMLNRLAPPILTQITASLATPTPIQDESNNKTQPTPNTTQSNEQEKSPS